MCLSQFKFSEYISNYYGIFKKEKKYYMIFENLKQDYKKPITIDIKIGSSTFRKGEDDTQLKRSRGLNINDVKTIRHHLIDTVYTISGKVGSRVEGITGIERSIKKNVYNRSIADYNSSNVDIVINKISNIIKIIDTNEYNLYMKYDLYMKNLLKISSLRQPFYVRNNSLFYYISGNKTKLKSSLMIKNPLTIFKQNFDSHINESQEKENKIILNMFEEDLYDIIDRYVYKNITGSYFFSSFTFIGSSLLFTYEKDGDNSKGKVNFIDFGHPINLFIRYIKLDKFNKNKKYSTLFIKAIFDNSISIINLYIMIFFVLNDELIYKRLLRVLEILTILIKKIFYGINNKIIFNKITYEKIYKKIDSLTYNPILFFNKSE